ncbi:MAG: alanine--tRNA ligase [Puniceicoccales bacterium]|jgi:alanyl-tRNA synthetase|nr:alanine--tRNA ligase [Puniceicoccales bacterium]
MNSDEIRQSFLDFFENYGHKIVKSSSLMPDAPNLLFTNAGMNQFVPIFLGATKTQFQRAADTQKCIRAGGKHNDLDDVGFDTYHHTFFEMLGNWSFGDYFKREAIEMAWELLTTVWKMPKNRLYATVYAPNPDEPAEFDGESHEIWEKIFHGEGMDPKIHIIKGSKRDNFWMMGDTGPCGPCTEVHIDLTPSGDNGVSLVNTGSPWCIELWNLVFIEFNSNGDGTFSTLQSKHVDTGAGLERIVGILAKTKNFSDFSLLPSNYDSDLFSDTFAEIGRMCGRKYHGTVPQSRSNMSEDERTDFWFRAIADHVRTLTFAIGDGIFPSNEGRGYVLRRILRRAVMFGNLLKMPHGFFANLASVVIDKMGKVFPELVEQKAVIEKALQNEEQSFSRTIDRGVAIFHEICEESVDEISGNDAFLLYDTYGFPPDLTQLMAMERGISVDMVGFEDAMGRQRALGRATQKRSAIEVSDSAGDGTKFTGYAIDAVENVAATVVDIVSSGNRRFLMTDKTPFYAESGGQVGDRGTGTIGGKVFTIVDVQRDKNGRHLHEMVNFDEEIVGGEGVLLSVDKTVRLNTTRNHSATHLLDAALRKILGNHVKQAGSCVDDKRLRFDFNVLAPPTERELEDIESLVMEKILECIDSEIFEVPANDIPAGCVANFGEKYGDVVRVVKFGDFSMELCGGCHVGNTSEIACFKIVSCCAIASGIRRIEAISGWAAFDFFRTNCKIVDHQCKSFSCQSSEVTAKTESLLSRCRELEKSAKAARNATLQNMATKIAKSAKAIGDGLFRVEQKVDDVQQDELRPLAVNILSEIVDGVVILTAPNDQCYSIVACCSQSAISKGHRADDIVKSIAHFHGGSGGGRQDFAMGGYAIN